MTGTLESITALTRTAHQLDVTVLLRTLYEHVVTFCWIAADPGDRFIRFIQNAHIQG